MVYGDWVCALSIYGADVQQSTSRNRCSIREICQSEETFKVILQIGQGYELAFCIATIAFLPHLQLHSQYFACPSHRAFIAEPEIIVNPYHCHACLLYTFLDQGVSGDIARIVTLGAALSPLFPKNDS